MKKTLKIFALALMLIGMQQAARADEGGRKSKERVKLNVRSQRPLSSNLLSNLQSGLTYTGSSLLSSSNAADPYSPSVFTQNGYSSYQKGNTIYLQPVKQTVILPEVKSGYAGMKLVIRRN